MEEKKDNLPKRNKNRDSVGSIDFEGSVADGKSNDSNDEVCTNSLFSIFL